MKKFITILLTMVMVLSLTACQAKPEEKEEVKNLEGTTSEIIDSIYAEKESGLMVQTMPIDLADANAVKSFTGLDSAEKVKEAAASEAMIGSQAYSMVVVRLNDAKDANEVLEAMKTGIDKRKWVCVEADDLSAVAYGDVIMLAMVSSELSDTITSADLVSAFKTVCGGTLTIE